jgi:hypothetical protein
MYNCRSGGELYSFIIRGVDTGIELCFFLWGLPLPGVLTKAIDVLKKKSVTE